MDAFYGAAPVPETPKLIRYSETVGAYNFRRYSRPWIAKITAWPVGRKPDLAWGGYAGNDRGGELEIMALPGSILRSGQKDLRKPTGGSNDWWEAMPDGAMRQINQLAARELYAARSGK